MAITDAIAGIDKGYKNVGQSVLTGRKTTAETNAIQSDTAMSALDKAMNIKIKAANLQTYQQDAQRRAAERQVAVDQAKREHANKGALDAESKLKIAESVGTLQANIKTQEDFAVVRDFLGADSEDTYNMVLNHMDPHSWQKSSQALGLNGDWKHDSPRLKYASERLFQNPQFLMQMQQLKTKGEWAVAAAGAGSSGGTGVTPSAPPGPNRDYVNASIMNDPDLGPALTTMAGAPNKTSWAGIQQAMTDKRVLVTGANQIWTNYYESAILDQQNRARAYMKAHKGETMEINVNAAHQKALFDTKAFLHTVDGDGTIGFLSPSRAQERFQNLMVQYRQEYRNDPNFLAQPSIAAQQEWLRKFTNYKLQEDYLRAQNAQSANHAAR